METEERQRQKINELEASLAKHQAYEREYQDLKRRMKEMLESSSSSKQTEKVVQAVSSSDDDGSDEEDDASCVYPALTTLKSVTFDHLQQMVSAFSSPTQLPPLDKQSQKLAVQDTSVLQKHMVSQWPLKTSLVVRRVMKCGSHAWVPGPLQYWASDNLQGRVVVEGLGLQYRDFDNVLHNALMSFQGPANTKKRKFMHWREEEEDEEEN
ncbi:hypothetical protein FIBSPDRAFT_481701 [Athelia psychrophila]|uniref:Uncharacterized protein n=1 Tax=Athelia psychrophila TaxID=1759441 RepID=A0A166VGM1_9AGAM|nr:hypothetical protein FIBSPDRAFT_481701 [Fibularhizoctonia sp. CBS 109695]